MIKKHSKVLLNMSIIDQNNFFNMKNEFNDCHRNLFNSFFTNEKSNKLMLEFQNLV